MCLWVTCKLERLSPRVTGNFGTLGCLFAEIFNPTSHQYIAWYKNGQYKPPRCCCESDTERQRFTRMEMY